MSNVLLAPNIVIHTLYIIYKHDTTDVTTQTKLVHFPIFCFLNISLHFLFTYYNAVVYLSPSVKIVLNIFSLVLTLLLCFYALMFMSRAPSFMRKIMPLKYTGLQKSLYTQNKLSIKKVVKQKTNKILIWQ